MIKETRWVSFLKEGTMVFVLVLFLTLIVLGIIENYIHQKRLKRIKLRILVNGTRGKTSIVRILTKALNSHGIKTVGRTTGSEAQILLPDGKIEPVVRKRKARITELIRFVKKAVGQEAEAIVVECMALGRENQRTVANKLIKPDYVIICNSYVDHIPEIGETREETIYSLAQSIPKGSTVYSFDKEYGSIKDINFHLVDKKDFPSFNLSTHEDNIAICSALLANFGITESDVIDASREIIPDIGLHQKMILPQGAEFRPYFSINDLDTMALEIEKASSSGKAVKVIFNNRGDREFRIFTFVSALGKQNVDVIVIGEYKKKVKAYIRLKTKLSVREMKADALIGEMKSSDSGNLYLGLGNIKGDGEKVVRAFIKEN